LHLLSHPYRIYTNDLALQLCSPSLGAHTAKLPKAPLIN
jgi:hypothetical protein